MRSKTAFALLTSLIVFFVAGSAAPTPLYPVYQAAWGFTPITTTVVFATYAVAVLSALLVLGSLSDHVGRRPVLLAAAVLQGGAMVVFATAHGVSALLIARVIQGIATGAAAGAVGAALLDVDKVRGTTANAVGPMIGTAVGGLLSGVFVQSLPAPTVLVYLVLGTVFVAQAIGIALMPETVRRRPGALRSLRPHFRLPAAVRRPLLVAVPALVAAWALVGFYAALGPALVRQLVGASLPVVGGLALFVFAASGAIAVLLSRTQPAALLARSGVAGLIAGVGVTMVAVDATSLGLFLVGTAIAGAGFGGAFQGAVRSVLADATAEHRAGILSIMYVVAYLAFGLPVIFAGARIVHGASVIATAQVYSAAVIALALVALLGGLVRRSTVVRGIEITLPR